jgi:hypothetical protein
MSRRRGRPVIDVEWNAVISRSIFCVPHEEDDNEELIEDWRLTGKLPHGCKIRPGMQDKALEKVWLCQMYLGKKQRIIGTGSLHQCARLYDAALLRFEKYRSHPGELWNFDKAQARTDNTIEAEMVSYLSDLEALLKERDLLTTNEERKQVAELKECDRRHDRTVAGRLESTQHAIIDQLESMKIAIADIRTAQISSAMALSALQSLLTTDKQPPGPQQEAKTLVPSIPAIFSRVTAVTPVGAKSSS